MKGARFCLLLGLSLACLTWWILYVPYHPQRLRDAIPAGASFVTSHDNVAGRWDEVSRNPLTRSLISSLGLDPLEVDELSADEQFQAWLPRLASDELLIAYTPSLIKVGDSTWMFTSWMGGQSQKLRWALRWGKGHSFERMGSHGGRVLWTLKAGRSTSRARLMFALVEGGVIGCLSEQPDALPYILDTYDGRAPSSGRIFVDLVRKAGHAARGFDDQGCFGLNWQDESFWCTYGFSQMGSEGMDGEVWLPLEADPNAPQWDRSASVEHVQSMVGNFPLAMLALSDVSLKTGFRDVGERSWSVLVNDTVNALNTGTAFLSFVGGECSDRFLGLKLPGLVLGVEADDEAIAWDLIQRWLDHINARCRWGLIPSRPDPVSEPPLFQLESTVRQRGVARFIQKRLAYTVDKGWFLLGSSADTLLNLLAYAGASPAVSRAAWSQAAGPEAEWGYMWIDLEALRKYVKPVLQIYAHKLLFEDPDASLETRQALNVAKAWVEALAPMGSLRVWLAPAQGGIKLGFSMGAQQGQGPETTEEHAL